MKKSLVVLWLLLFQCDFYNKLLQQKLEPLIHFFLVWNIKHFYDVINTRFC